MRKLISILLGVAAFNLFATGIVFLISNIQGQRIPDGYPLDPEWLVWGLLVVAPILIGFLAIMIWPEEEKEEEAYSLYVGKSKKLLHP